jgi:hypothetical protein
MKRIFAVLAVFAAVASGPALAQVSPYSGGSGARNPNTSIITVAGPLTTVGNFLTTLTITAPTAITLPTSGTLATTAQITGGTLPGSFTTLSASANSQILATATGSDLRFIVQNNGNTAPSTASIGITAGGGADAFLIFTQTAVTNWLTGIDSSDSNTYKISASAAFGTNDVVRVASTGVAVIGAFSPTSFNDDAGNLIISSTNPTIASGFGTGPTCSPCNNTAAFKVTVGTGGLDSTGVITMPVSGGGWACHVLNLTDTSTAHMLRMTSMSTTSLTVTNSIIGGGNQPFGVANVLLFQCAAF